MLQPKVEGATYLPIDTTIIMHNPCKCKCKRSEVTPTFMLVEATCIEVTPTFMLVEATCIIFLLGPFFGSCFISLPS
ncbi:hypothetical protein ACSQ67_024743 [Phaseolus vulgaris]